jgi:hypothetical protein
MGASFHPPTGGDSTHTGPGHPKPGKRCGPAVYRGDRSRVETQVGVCGVVGRKLGATTVVAALVLGGCTTSDAADYLFRSIGALVAPQSPPLPLQAG